MNWAALLQHFLHFSIFLIYCAAGFFLYRWGYPRMVASARVLATIFLGTQALTLVMGVTFEPPTAFARWFWHLNTEWNFASSLAATQFMLVGAIALCIALPSVERPAMQRVYFLGVAAFFCYLGYDEFHMIHEWLHYWEYQYGAIGVALIVATVAIFRRSSKREKRFAACIPFGLALAASGAIIFDFYSLECRAWGNIYILGGCVEVLTMEESLELLGIWVALAGALGIFSNLSPHPKLIYRRALYALPVILVFLLLSSGAVLPISQQGADKGSVILASGVKLQGYEIEKDRHSIRVHLFLTPSGWSFDGLGYSIGFVDQDRLDAIAMSNAIAGKQLSFLVAPGYIPVYRQWLELDIPLSAPSNRAFWIVLTFWRREEGDFSRQEILSSDLPLLGDSQVILDEFVIKQDSDIVATPALATFDNGFTLEEVELPQRARAGETMRITVGWRSEAEDTSDYAQFLHLGHDASGEWFVFDRQPLGDRLPTRLWYSGMSDTETWRVPLPSGLAAGRYAVFTGLYRDSDKERLIARDASGEPFLDARIPLGSVTVQNP